MSTKTNNLKKINADSKRCYLGLGSNLTNELGDPSQHIANAIEKLKKHPDISYVCPSSLYASKPMGPKDQPDFTNAVVELETTLSAIKLLDLCQQLEDDAQRVRLRRWGERSLDIDVLLYAEQSIQTARLTVPHTGIFERNFVLVPLHELDANLIINGTPIKKLPMSQDWTGLKKLN